MTPFFNRCPLTGHQHSCYTFSYVVLKSYSLYSSLCDVSNRATLSQHQNDFKFVPISARFVQKSSINDRRKRAALVKQIQIRSGGRAQIGQKVHQSPKKKESGKQRKPISPTKTTRFRFVQWNVSGCQTTNEVLEDELSGQDVLFRCEARCKGEVSIDGYEYTSSDAVKVVTAVKVRIEFGQVLKDRFLQHVHFATRNLHITSAYFPCRRDHSTFVPTDCEMSKQPTKKRKTACQDTSLQSFEKLSTGSRWCPFWSQNWLLFGQNAKEQTVNDSRMLTFAKSVQSISRAARKQYHSASSCAP